MRLPLCIFHSLKTSYIYWSLTVGIGWHVPDTTSPSGRLHPRGSKSFDSSASFELSGQLFLGTTPVSVNCAAVFWHTKNRIKVEEIETNHHRHFVHTNIRSFKISIPYPTLKNSETHHRVIQTPFVFFQLRRCGVRTSNPFKGMGWQ